MKIEQDEIDGAYAKLKCACALAPYLPRLIENREKRADFEGLVVKCVAAKSGFDSGAFEELWAIWGSDEALFQEIEAICEGIVGTDEAKKIMARINAEYSLKGIGGAA